MIDGLKRAMGGKREETGWFVAVVGPDGVGKTRLASELLDQWAGLGAYVHFAPPVFRPAPPRPPANAGASPDKAAERGSPVLGWLRLARNVVRFWVGYLARVRPVVERGGLVVADRWLFGYVGQPYALRFYGPDKLAHIALRISPKPDLVVNLVAPPNLIYSRKQDLTTEQISAEIGRWSTLRMGRLLSVDASASPQSIAEQVLFALRVGHGGAE